MYCDYYGFCERPFTIAPNPRYLYMSERHREALAHLLFGIGDGGGFVLLTGEVGTGKTTVCRCLLGQVPEATDIAFVFNPKLTALELLQTICDELRLAYDPQYSSVKTLNDAINQHLLASYGLGRHTVLLIDEAQNLSADVLEQVRLLTNLETNEQKLLQVILIGQPELREMLAEPHLRQLSQRVTARYHLEPLTRTEISGYLAYRLSVAGRHKNIFDDNAVDALQRISQGVPRLINTICDRALLGGYAQNSPRISKKLIVQAAAEVMGRRRGWMTPSTAPVTMVTPPRRSRSVLFNILLAATLVLVGVMGGIGVSRYTRNGHTHNEPTSAYRPDVGGAAMKTAHSKAAQTKAAEPTSVLAAASTTVAGAFRALSTLWQEPGITQCQTRTNNLLCQYEHMTWGQLLALNYPAVLTVTAHAGERRYLTLISVDDGVASVQGSAGVFEISVDEIARYWTGETRYLWRAPPDYHAALMLGDRGHAVKWLQRRLLKLRADVKDAALFIPDTIKFDQPLKDAVMTFQKAHGLIADGIAGPQTLMLLYQLTDTSIPRLSVGTATMGYLNVANP